MGIGPGDNIDLETEVCMASSNTGKAGHWRTVSSQRGEMESEKRGGSPWRYAGLTHYLKSLDSFIPALKDTGVRAPMLYSLACKCARGCHISEELLGNISDA